MKIKSNRTFVVAGLLFIVACLIFYHIVTLLSSSIQKIDDSSRIQSNPEPIIDGFQLTEYNSEGKSFTIDAEKFFIRNKQIKPFGFRIALSKTAELEDVKVTFYKNGEVISYMKSGTASMDTKSRDCVFENKAVLITKDRRILDADRIIWDNSQRTLLAKGDCSLGADGKRQNADVIHTDIGLTNYSLKNTKTGKLKLLNFTKN